MPRTLQCVYKSQSCSSLLCNAIAVVVVVCLRSLTTWNDQILIICLTFIWKWTLALHIYLMQVLRAVLRLSGNCKISTVIWFENLKLGSVVNETQTRVLLISDAPCEITYQPLGCYGEDSSNPAFTKELLNEMTPMSPKFKGVIMEFGNNWQPGFNRFLCRCAREAHLNGNSMFGVHNHGKLTCLETLW